MLGIEHIASRGSIMLDYYGRNVGVKIMPTGVDPSRFQEGFSKHDTVARRAELVSQVPLSSFSKIQVLAVARQIPSRCQKSDTPQL